MQSNGWEGGEKSIKDYKKQLRYQLWLLNGGSCAMDAAASRYLFLVFPKCLLLVEKEHHLLWT